ncbi:hypothetical protein IFM89_008260 [Coptis chinensis]|uniref:S1 motif domain-containing protein n=1 Tax=Coptis chinensis TaxID=261450 RepID=A0A835I6J3_9MAGN|nr:hypothetical protein IFM89_008260 [Coptis chinensis]
MGPVVPFCVGNITCFPGTICVAKTNERVAEHNYSGSFKDHALSFQNFLLPRSASVRLVSTYRRWSAVQVQRKSRIPFLATNGTEIAVKEVSAVSSEDTSEIFEDLSDVVISETPSVTSDAHTKQNVKSNRRRPLRKSVMPPVKNEELVPGATFIGKVRSVQHFGAFVDIGAFTEGLIHISNLSDSFVTAAKDIVSIGQEVKVRVVEVSVESGRISLTMRGSNDSNDLQQMKDSSADNSGNKQRPARKEAISSEQKSVKFVKGRELKRTVENSSRGGEVVSLPKREERFLPISKESFEDSGNMRKSVMPPVENEELVPGATFTGKVRSIQRFGAFVDIGAFTEGLIHISNISDSFVTDVKDILSIGQEVKVRVLEVSFKPGRISLTLRDSNDSGDLHQVKGSSFDGSGNNQRPERKKAINSQKKSSKFVKGQELVGTVKNLTRVGAFLSLPEGEEGFLPISEESDEVTVNVLGGSSLQVGEEVSVRVLHVTKGQVTLTMKIKDSEKLDEEVYHGIVHTATNPFVLAFLKNKEIAKFLDERKNMCELPE